MVNNKYKFNSGYSIEISLTSNPSTCKYRFYTDTNELMSEITDVLPLSLKPKGQVMMEIKLCIDPLNSLKSNILKSEMMKAKKELQSIANSLRGELDVELAREQQAKDLNERRKIKTAKEKLEALDQPLLYIGSIIDWLTAGERINTLICFCAFSSQIILKHPISVIGYGESSSGKTFVGNVALSLIPQKYVIDEKTITQSALFNRAKDDPHFYDGKIVSYGDMGGQKDRENQQEVLDLMKELQSDGKLTKPLSVKDERGNWVTEDLHLIGKPCLFYSTVPVHIDEQELSRSIVYSPRVDNREEFNKMKKMLSLKMGVSYNRYKDILEKAEIIPYMVEHLRKVMENVVIINPYIDIVLNFLQQSKFYKRDSEKYFNLLNTITAINYYNNPKWTMDDGTKAVITSKNDVELFRSLLAPYLSSIAINIKPQSAEIYRNIKDNIDSWKWEDNSDEYKEGITARDYFEKLRPPMSLRNLRRHFSELYQEGLLNIVGSDGKANIYDLGNRYSYDKTDLLDEKEIYEFVMYELGSEVADIVQNDLLTSALSIMNQHREIEEAPWSI